MINLQARPTCDNDVDGAAGIAGDVASRTGIFTGCLSTTVAQLNEDLVSIGANLHLVVRLERLAVFEPRHAYVSACTSSVTTK